MKIRKIFLLLTSILILSNCTTTKSTADMTEEKKISTAKINAQLGIAYLEQHNTALAKQKLLLALDEAPHIPETWYSMAYFQEATGNLDEAKKHYLKAVNLAPRRGDVQNNYGTFLCRSGDYRGAIQHFLLAANDIEYLNTADAYENAGLCAMKIPDREQAKQYFHLALLQDPNRSVSFAELKKLRSPHGE